MEHLLQNVILIVASVCLTALAVVPQEKIRTIKELPLRDDSPIVIVSRELGDKTFDARKRVLGDQDWLKHLTLGVKNVSDKNIVYFEIDLPIPKQGTMPGAFGVAIFFGNRMAPAITVPEAPILRPGEIVKVSLSANEIESWDKVLKKYEVEEFDLVTLDIRTVHFDDGTGWQLGIPLQQDPNYPWTWRSLIGQKSMTNSSYLIAMLVRAPLFEGVKFSYTKKSLSSPFSFSL